MHLKHCTDKQRSTPQRFYSYNSTYWISFGKYTNLRSSQQKYDDSHATYVAFITWTVFQAEFCVDFNDVCTLQIDYIDFTGFRMSALRISSSCHSLSPKPLGPKRFTTLAVKSSTIAGEESELLSLLMSLNLNEMPVKKHKLNHLIWNKIRKALEESTNLLCRAKFTS